MKPVGKDISKIIKSGIAAAMVPVLFLYIFLDKPDYKILTAVSRPVSVTAGAVGDLITWPIRAAGHIAGNWRDHSRALKENKALREQLDSALADRAECAINTAEIGRLERALDIKKSTRAAQFATVVHVRGVMAREFFDLDRGENDGVKSGMVVISPAGAIAGIITSSAGNFSRVRALADAKSEIPVRVAGTNVFGFLRGRGGAAAPVFEMFSDQEFVPTAGDILVTSKIGGNIPDGLHVGKISAARGKMSAEVELSARGDKLHDVFVVK